MSSRVADLERRLEAAEDENDALELRLAKIEDTALGGERTPSAVVDRLAKGAQRVASGGNIATIWRRNPGSAPRCSAKWSMPKRREASAAVGPRRGSTSTILSPGADLWRGAAT